MPSFNPKKRRREGVNVDVKLVEIYDDLSNENDEIRLKAASDLLSRFTPDANPTAEDIEKVLLRLFRGLCSSRKAARLGFSIALTELLSILFSPSEDGEKKSQSGLDVSKTIDLLESNTNTTSSESGQEEKDRHFGRLFGAEAILKSSILYQPGVQFENWTRLLSLIFELANKKPWLREECGYIIFYAIRDIGARNRSSKYVDSALAALCQNNLAKTPEGVAIWIAAMELSLSPAVVFPSDVWSHDNPLNTGEKASLGKIMKQSSKHDSSNGEEAKVKSSGVWNPKLPFAWDPILTKLYAIPTEKRQGEGKVKKTKATQLTFADFWAEVVDRGLFADASSEERKYWGFLVFMKVLNEAPIEVAKLIFTKNFMRCMMNQLAVEDRYLHKIAVKAAKSIQARALKESEFAYPALCGLMGARGAINFDQVAKVKIVEKIVSNLSQSVVKQLLPVFEGMIICLDGDEKVAASRRQQIANILQTITKSQMATAKDSDAEELDEAIEMLIIVLARYTYFSGNGAIRPKPPVSDATRELFRNKIMACLNIVISNRKRSADIAYKIIQKIRDLEENGESGKFIIDMSESITESVQAAFKTLKKIDKKSKQVDGRQDPAAQGLKLLYSMTILQVYNGDADAVSMLDELKLCYDKFLSHKKADHEDGDQAADALVEIFLSFASKPSQLFRKMSEQVFGAFSSKLTPTGLQSLLAILDAKESLAGQQELFEKDDEDEGDEEEDEDSDVEMIDGSDVEIVDAASGSESDEDEDEEDDEEDENLAEFDAKLAAALGTHRADKDLEASEGSDDGSDMGDDDMEALDAQLVKVFQARDQASTKKKDRKDAKETMINFKNRVLDLLEIYVKKCHSNPIALDIIIPLLQLLRRSSVEQLVKKTANILREYTKLCKGASVPKVESVEPIWELLRQVHNEATHSASNSHASSCSLTSLLLVKILVAHDKESVPGIVDIYADTRKKQLLSNKCHVHATFFSDWNNWCVAASKQLKN
ncbi:hypothetical protein FQN49_001579 [Arthroderma sp. PD_2]|nr:hypothetical protein FQN49_001579 [Arthroderma sp. PD_2]